MKKYLVNEEINFPQVLVVSDSGNELLSSDKALILAGSKDLDLVCISQESNPPACKIMDYSKFIYALNKKEKEIKKHNKQFIVKEVKFSLNIASHDMDIKIKHIREFLSEGKGVQIVIGMKGRELASPAVAVNLANTIFDRISDIAKKDKEPKHEGKFVRFLVLKK